MIQTTIGIEGMMCGMCEAHVADAVRGNFSVRKASANRRRKCCVVLSDEPLDEAAVRAAIDSTGYKVTSVASEPYHKRGLFGRG